MEGESVPAGADPAGTDSRSVYETWIVTIQEVVGSSALPVIASELPFARRYSCAPSLYSMHHAAVDWPAGASALRRLRRVSALDQPAQRSRHGRLVAGQQHL